MRTACADYTDHRNKSRCKEGKGVDVSSVAGARESAERVILLFKRCVSLGCHIESDDPQPRKMWERVPWEEVAGGRFSILSSKLARATTLSKVSGASFFLLGVSVTGLVFLMS